MSDELPADFENTAGLEAEWLDWYRIREADRLYWLPLKAELERLRHRK